MQAAKDAMRRIKEAATGESLTPTYDPMPSVQRAVYAGNEKVVKETKPKENKIIQKPLVKGKLRPPASVESTQSSDSLNARAPRIDKGSMGNSAGLINSASKTSQLKHKT